MLSLLKDIPLKIKLLFMAVPPLLIAIVYSIVIVVYFVGEKNSLENTKYSIYESEALAKCIHFLQRERGLSLGYVASKGTQNRDLLVTARDDVDRALRDLNLTFSQTKGDNFLLNYIQDLKHIREDINSLKATAQIIAPFYTKLISTSIDNVVLIPNKMSDIEGRNIIQAYTHLATAKESLGLARGTLNKVFTQNSMDPYDFALFGGLKRSMSVNIDKFSVLATYELGEFHKAHFQGKSVDKTFDIMEEAYIKNIEGGFDIDPRIWWEHSTIAIDLLRDIEIKLYNDIYSLMDLKLNNANNQIYITSFVVFFAIVIGIIITLWLINNTIRSMSTIQNGLISFFEFLNRQTSKIEPIKLNSKDEFGQMAGVINQNIQKTKDSIEEDNALIEDAKVVMARVKNGWYSQLIEKTTQNNTLEEFKNNLNEMLNITKQRFVDINKVLQEYSKHNYTSVINLNPNDEKGGVLENFIKGIHQVQTSINQMLSENQTNGLHLSESSNILLANVNQLNQSSNEAAANLEETAAALEEITSTIVSNTENVVKMAHFASELSQSAQEGMVLARKTNNSMDEINTQVNLINEAISVIDNIAFQTNILSLNAAVEAATAGEAGAGFAVVASEVRNLAARSAEAAKEIKTIVELATAKANEGKNIANEMIFGYAGLNDNITKTIDIISDIEIASKEQQSGIEQINDAIAGLDQQTQANASIAAQTQDVALMTDKIAKTIVEETKKKRFIKIENSFNKNLL